MDHSPYLDRPLLPLSVRCRGCWNGLRWNSPRPAQAKPCASANARS